jgi:hypothetical protein
MENIPTSRALIFNTALPAADNNLLAAALTPFTSPSYLSIYVCSSIAGILRVRRTQGGVTISENLNSGTALVAASAYGFTVPFRKEDAINFWFSTTGGTMLAFVVNEHGVI